MDTIELAGPRLLVDSSDEPPAMGLLLDLEPRLLGFCASRCGLPCDLLNLSGYLRQPLLGLRHKLLPLSLQPCCFLALVLPSLQTLAALLVALLHFLDLVCNLGGLLAEELRFRLRDFNDLPHLRKALLEGHELGLLGLLCGPQVLSLVLQALIDLLKLQGQACSVPLSTLQLLLAERRLLARPFRVRQQPLGRLRLLLGGHL
mmetsp:Transcript_54682/g.123005  ORF Transcript_54682/g.123005 Transcript_54682/m.123005 type:complete len:203 (+) Transcript_54682:2320-2928(+)